MDVKVDEIEVEVETADIPQTGDRSTPKSNSKTPKKKVQDSRDTNNTFPELPASTVLLEDIPTAPNVPSYTSDTNIMDENMYDSDSTITDPDMADYLLAIRDTDSPDIADMQNTINPDMQNPVLHSATRNTVDSIVQDTVNHAMQSTIHPTMQNTGVNPRPAIWNMVNFAIQNAINPSPMLPSRITSVLLCRISLALLCRTPLILLTHSALSWSLPSRTSLRFPMPANLIMTQRCLKPLKKPTRSDLHLVVLKLKTEPELITL